MPVGILTLEVHFILYNQFAEMQRAKRLRVLIYFYSPTSLIFFSYLFAILSFILYRNPHEWHVNRS